MCSISFLFDMVKVSKESWEKFYPSNENEHAGAEKSELKEVKQRKNSTLAMKMSMLGQKNRS